MRPKLLQDSADGRLTRPQRLLITVMLLLSAAILAAAWQVSRPEPHRGPSLENDLRPSDQQVRS